MTPPAGPGTPAGSSSRIAPETPSRQPGLLVSIAIPTWNGEAHLEETLRSALAQTHADFELLVVDDASTDRTLEIVRSFEDPRLLAHRNARRLGIPRNWNRCLELARSRYVKLLFQDDVLFPPAVERLAAALDAEPSAALAFSRREIRHEGEDTSRLPLAGPRYPGALSRFYASIRSRGPVGGIDLVRHGLDDGADLATNVVGEPSFVLLRRAAALAAGGFDVRMSQLVDWDLWLRLGRDAPIAFVDQSLGVFRVHPRAWSAAHHRSLRVKREVLRLLARVHRTYGSVLSPDETRRLRRLRWRYRRHLLGEGLRSAGAAWPRRPRRSP